MITTHSTNRLGGAITAVEIADNVIDNLFDDVSGAEHFAGDTEYRCFFVKNESLVTQYDARVWISQADSATDDDILIGLDPSSGSPVQTIASEQAVPAGVTFSTPTEYIFLLIGDMVPGASRAVWVKRVVSPGFVEYVESSFVLKFSYDT